MIDQLIALDKSVASALASLPHPWLANSAFWWISLSAYAVVIAVVIFYAYRYFKFKRHGKLAFWIPVSSAALFIGIELVKRLVERVRPNGDLLSFPSRHTALALFIALVLPVERKWKALLFVWVALVGFSRLWLAEHWLSDVLVGAGIGLIVGWLVKKKVSAKTSSPQ